MSSTLGEWMSSALVSLSRPAWYPTAPLWLPHTSSFDFCEKNYDHTFLICELWNSLTSLWICLCGYLGYWYVLRVRAGPLFRAWWASTSSSEKESIGFLSASERKRFVDRVGADVRDGAGVSRTLLDGTPAVEKENGRGSPRSRFPKPGETNGGNGKTGASNLLAANDDSCNSTRGVVRLLFDEDERIAARVLQSRLFPRYVVCWWFFLLVGSGSVLFHGTLKRAGQALDELPMVIGNVIFFYCLYATRKNKSTYADFRTSLSVAAGGEPKTPSDMPTALAKSSVAQEKRDNSSRGLVLGVLGGLCSAKIALYLVWEKYEILQLVVGKKAPRISTSYENIS